MKNKILGLALIVGGLSLALLPSNVNLVNADESDEISYYVAFSTQNYNVRNTNKMTKGEDGTYVLKNVSLSSSNDFYVISSTEVKYASSSSDNMKVESEDTLKYNIYFNPDVTYNAATVASTDYYESNSHVTYDFYIPGAYTLTVSDGTTYDLTYNPKQNLYEGYYLPHVSLTEGQSLSVSGINYSDNSSSSYSYQDTVPASGDYRIIFTPGTTTSNNAYRFNKDGTYGTGDDYTYNLHVEDEEYYYVAFEEKLTTTDTATRTVASGVSGYRLTRNEDYPNSEIYYSTEFFNNEEDHTIKYSIYRYSTIFKKFEMVDDDNDEDTSVSKVNASNVSWYGLNFTVAEDQYTTVIVTKSRDFKGYYIVGKFNNYGFDDKGNVNVTSTYKFKLLDKTSSYYTTDYDQYLLNFKLYLKDLDEDDANFTFYITNGKDRYQNGTSKICLNIPGTYDILFSDSHQYKTDKNYRFLLLNDDTVYDAFAIASVDDFIKYAEAWNHDSETSKFKIYNVTADLDFKGVDIPSISIFSGELKGNNHTFSNITISEDDEYTEYGLIHLVTKYAKISNLTFKNIDIESEDSSYVGIFGKNYGSISNITVDGKISGGTYVGIIGYNGNYKVDDSDSSVDSNIEYGFGVAKNFVNSATILGKVNVGSIAGFNGGKIISSSNTGTVNNKSYPSSTNVINIGGIAGYSTGQILDTVNEGKVGYSGVGQNVGGIAGLSSGTTYFTTNKGLVNGKNNVGGIAGYFGSASNDDKTNNTITTTTTNITDLLDNLYGQNSNDIGYTEEADIASHLINYCINRSAINGTSYVGGLVGYNNATDLTVSNSLSDGDVYSNSGTYAGGLVGYMSSGTIKSCLASSLVESNGSVNEYVGGIAGYLGGSLIASYSCSTVIGTDYLGGLVGQGSSACTIESCYTNSLILPKTTSTYIGNIAGFIDSIDEPSGTYGDRIKYNYYIGYDEDIGGINSINYGLTSKYAAYRISPLHLMSKDTLSLYLNKHFGHETVNDDSTSSGSSSSSGTTAAEESGTTAEESSSSTESEASSTTESETTTTDIYYFEASKELYYYPLLSNFVTCDEIDDDEFDDDLNLYDTYISYFNKNKDTYTAMQKDAALASVKIAYMEWKEDEGDLNTDNYIVNKIVKVYFGEAIPDNPDFLYATYSGGKDYYYGDSYGYIVTWNKVDESFVNQTVYASYSPIASSLKDEEYNIFVEGDFENNPTISVTKTGNKYKITLKVDGEEITMRNVTVKVYSSTPKAYSVFVNGKQVTSSVYGSYITFKLSSSNQEFTLETASTNVLTWVIVGIVALTAVIIIVIIIVGVTVNKKEKAAEKEQLTNSKDKKGKGK